ncbi:hypothetical protein [Paenibacillus sp. 1_12]|uniref:hypothetical protein n=1 Tax=Paenibacillus sp. 1_12 TaxID=1566278 RepID=UPI00210DF145|nr:hypothetical protein [Paenibacillus sp. 1_12]
MVEISRILTIEVNGMQSGDGLVIILIILIAGFWIFLYIRNRMKGTMESESEGLTLPEETPVSSDEVTRLLEENGYKVISGKQRIPIHITINDGEPLHSRLFIDYFVEQDGVYFTVKVAKERKPMETTGSSIRDHLLAFHLLYPQTSGVLYVDPQQHRIQCIRFQIDNEDEV